MLYTRFELPNGLVVIHHPDQNTQLAVMNILYKVGSKNESPDRTGFAHLFEHLMFGGSINIPEYDTPLQLAGGDNNAFTSNDITNYYLTVPKNNIETGFWLESDRMLSLAFSQDSLNIQKGVVIEEFRERYLNQPYGDLWHQFLPLAYKQHPYSWPTIGKDISHVSDATIDDVKSFFKTFYAPNNAILVVAGNIDLETTKRLCEKWFGPISAQMSNKVVIDPEPKQTEARFLKLSADVPFDMLVKAYHTCSRNDPKYYATDLISDFLGSGRSALLYNELVKKQCLFSELDCYITGDVEPGLLIIEGKLIKGVSIEVADNAVIQLLNSLLTDRKIDSTSLLRLKNKAETNIQFNDMKVLNRAMKLAYCEFMGDISLASKESEYYSKVSLNEVQSVCSEIFKSENSTTIYYQSNN
jgi:predicted Zn-dependent peptidase